MRRITLPILVLTTLSAGSPLEAWVLKGASWKTTDVPIRLQLGSEPLQFIDGSESWNGRAEQAAARWNAYIVDSRFETTSGPASAGGENNASNEVFFERTVYGRSFGTALAITRTWFAGDTVLESDVIVNSALTWNSYRGAPKRTAAGAEMHDIGRVLEHEFGHVLRLDHPDEHGQDVFALMNSSVGALASLMADDVNGARSMYGATSAPLPSSRPQLGGGGWTRVFARELPLAIRDRRTVKSVIQDNDGGTIQGTVIVKLDVRHASRGDLQIKLTGPNNKSATLFRGRKGDRRQRLKRMFRIPGKFSGASATGKWTISIKDRASGNEGALADWEVRTRTR